jgi:hypothetical protein
MAVQSVSTTKLPNQIAISPGVGNVLIIAGPSSAGPYDTLTPHSRASACQAQFGQGPLVEAACVAIEDFNVTVLCVRTHATTVGVAGALTTTRVASSTSVVTVKAGSVPYGDYEFGMVVTKILSDAGVAMTTGTLGTDNIYVKWTVDNFRTLGPETKLPDTATFDLSISHDVTGFDSGIDLTCAAGSLTVGDTFIGVSTAPVVTTADIATAIVAIRASAANYEFVSLASPLSDATMSTGVAGALDSAVVALAGSGKFRGWVGHAPIPGDGDDDSDYQASTGITQFAAYGSTTPGLVLAGACLQASRNPTWPAQYILPPSYVVAPWAVKHLASQSIADSDDGPLPGCQITDGNGNPLTRCHDEAQNPWADDARFCVLRTWPDKQGTYVNLPRLMAASGSAFSNLQRLRVWNKFATACYGAYRPLLQKRVDYDAATGHILESVAQKLEDDANAAIEGVMAGDCTAVRTRISRTDDLRADNPTVTVEGGVQPFAYPVSINLRLGFLLPA